MSLPLSLDPATPPALPALWLGIYAARVGMYMLAGRWLARRPSPLSARFWFGAPGLLLVAAEAAIANAVDRRLAPRGRWFVPVSALLVGLTSAVLAVVLVYGAAQRHGAATAGRAQ